MFATAGCTFFTTLMMEVGAKRDLRKYSGGLKDAPLFNNGAMKSRLRENQYRIMSMPNPNPGTPSVLIQAKLAAFTE
jgi:hypothetical protein